MFYRNPFLYWRFWVTLPPPKPPKSVADGEFSKELYTHSFDHINITTEAHLQDTLFLNYNQYLFQMVFDI